MHLRQKSNGKVSQATTKKQVCCFCNAEEIPFMCSLRKHKAFTIGSWKDFMQKVLFFLSLLRRKLAFLQSHCYLVFNSFSPVCDGACCEEASQGECLQQSLRMMNWNFDSKHFSLSENRFLRRNEVISRLDACNFLCCKSKLPHPQWKNRKSDFRLLSTIYLCIMLNYSAIYFPKLRSSASRVGRWNMKVK